MYQNVKKIIFTIVLMFTTIIIVNAQEQSETTSLPKKAKRKTIKYTEYQYAATGYVLNEQFVEGQKITFFDTDTIISGKYLIKDRIPYIDGTINLNREGSIKTGLFKVTNNENNELVPIPNIASKLNIEISDIYYYQDIDRNHKRDYFGTLILKKLPDNTFSINIKYKDFILETTIPSLSLKEFDYNDAMEYLKSEIIKSEKVKLSYNNGNVFIGSVVHKYDFSTNDEDSSPNYIPDSGEYKYATGEVSSGIFFCCSYQKAYLDKGTTIFADGTIEKDDWWKNYDLGSSEIERIYKNSKSPTEMLNEAKRINLEKNKKRQKSEIATNQVKKENLLKQQAYKKILIAKYGNYYGNEISQRHLIIGMTKAMVNEVWKKEYFNISTVLRNNQIIEIWVFNKEKMQMDIINEGIKNKGKEGGEAAFNTILMMNLYEEQFGKITFPKKLVLNNNKLTDIYN